MLMAFAVPVQGPADSLSTAVAFAVLYGIGWGIRTPVNNAIQGEYFGRKSQGTITGWLQSVSVPLTIAAPVAVGYVADVQGTYRTAFIVVAVIALAGSSLIFLATRPKAPTALAADSIGE